MGSAECLDHLSCVFAGFGGVRGPFVVRRCTQGRSAECLDHVGKCDYINNKTQHAPEGADFGNSLLVPRLAIEAALFSFSACLAMEPDAQDCRRVLARGCGRCDHCLELPRRLRLHEEGDVREGPTLSGSTSSLSRSTTARDSNTFAWFTESSSRR
jgi:hypothetical protein